MTTPPTRPVIFRADIFGKGLKYFAAMAFPSTEKHPSNGGWAAQEDCAKGLARNLGPSFHGIGTDLQVTIEPLTAQHLTPKNIAESLTADS
jgi:hypothetical protein